MSVIVPRPSTLAFLNAVIAALLNGASLCLYNTNHTPTPTDTASTFNAIEATFGGYARITLNSWSAAFLNASNAAETDELVRVFTATGAGLPQSIFGVYVLDAGGNLLYAELIPTGPVVLSAAGQHFAYQAVFTDKSEF